MSGFGAVFNLNGKSNDRLEKRGYRMKDTRTAAVLAVAILATSLAGCSTPTADPSVGASTAVSNSPAKDITHWAMPMDEYSTAILVDLTSYAENRRIETCLTEDGFSWPIPVEPTDDASFLAFPRNMSSFPALTVEIAKQYGYTAQYYPGPTPESQTAVNLNRIAESTPGLNATLLACREESRKTWDGEKVFDISNITGAWMGEARKDAPRDPAVKTAAKLWKACLAAVGYDVSISAPVGDKKEWMPTEKLGIELGFYAPPPAMGPLPTDGPMHAYGDTEVDPDSIGPRTPTSREISLAVADATCRESSGWTKAYYDAQWKAELAVVRKHADQLKTIKADIQALTAQARQIIAENPPLR
jgi:thymidylate synthase